jgi:hypothetical protein
MQSGCPKIVRNNLMQGGPLHKFSRNNPMQSGASEIVHARNHDLASRGSVAAQ